VPAFYALKGGAAERVMFVGFANAKSSVFSRRRQTHDEPQVRKGVCTPLQHIKNSFLM